MPTRLLRLLGLIIDPSVSLPNAPAASPIALPTALPELEPDGSTKGKYGEVVWPPRPEKPEGTAPRKLAHSERLALPRIIAPAARRCEATVASRGTTEPRRANEPLIKSMSYIHTKG